MRYALIIAGGKGTRLWPMSTGSQPKQLIPFVNGKSLLQIAYERLEGLVENNHRFICAGSAHMDMIISRIPGMGAGRFIGEPVGRDTLNALAYSAAVIHKLDKDAVIGVFTADHIIQPEDKFRKIVEEGYRIAESSENTLVTFGITPDHPATGFGYLELGETLQGSSTAKTLKRFKEKPDLETAASYIEAGPESYLWNSGMFVWKASTLLNCVKKYEPEIYSRISELGESYGTQDFDSVISRIYPELKKISVDFAVMEPASEDPDMTIAAVPMPLSWLDIGSWPSYAETCDADADVNRSSSVNSVFTDCRGVLAVSDDPEHLITGIGLEDMIIIRTKKATLVCPKDRAQDIKNLYDEVEKSFGDEYI